MYSPGIVSTSDFSTFSVMLLTDETAQGPFIGAQTRRDGAEGEAAPLRK